MDNVILGGSSTEECLTIYDQSKELFHQAGMNLREWISNDEELNSRIPQKDRVKKATVKVLGLRWNTTEDTLQIKIKSQEEKEVLTKRSVLHQVARAFDPLGIFNPVLIKGRIQLQTMWRKNLQWDQVLPGDLSNRCHVLLKEIRACTTLKMEEPSHRFSLLYRC